MNFAKGAPGEPTLLSLDDASIVLGQRLDEQLWDQWPVGGRAVAEALVGDGGE